MTPAEICPANAETWAAWLRFVDVLTGKATGKPVRYGPGRGLWVGGRFVVGYAPGKKSGPSDLATWPNVLGKLYPALHCTSLTNLVLSWLLRRNEDYTHGGNVPLLMELLGADSTVHVFPGRCVYRGFHGQVTLLQPDGSAAIRSGFRRWPVMDAKELLARTRAGTLPTFNVFSQSTRTANGWNTDHHTGVWCAWEGKLYRIAADGMVAAGKYSATPVQWIEVNDANVGRFGAAVYRVWGIDTLDGSYGDQSRPIAELVLELL